MGSKVIIFFDSAKHLLNILLSMTQTHLYAKLLMKMLSKVLGTIDAAMLSARTAEGEHQRREATLNVSGDMGIGQFIDAVKERQNLAVVLQKADDRLVESRHVFVFLITPGVVRRTAVEHIAATITALILGNAFLIGEAENADYKRSPTLPLSNRRSLVSLEGRSNTLTIQALTHRNGMWEGIVA